MNDFQNESAASTSRSNRQLDAGADVLATWSETAGQSHRNAIYRALFSMIDGSLFRTHNVVDDVAAANEFFVVVKSDLVLKLRVNGFESFDVVYIGTWDDAPIA
jgi:hypothetical protein